MKKGGSGERVLLDTPINTTKNLKGQATGATMLILIILILFLAFAAITNPEEFKSTLSGSTALGTTTTFAVGTLQEGLSDNTTKTIPDITLETLASTNTLARLPDITASNGWFSREVNTQTFKLSNPETTDDAYIGFTIKEFKGTLIIKVNGNAIATGTYPPTNPSPIHIPSTYLKKENTLEFSTESGFFSGASYQLTDVVIIGTLYDTAPLKKTNTFALTPTEYDSTITGTLTYMTGCNQTTMKELTVTLNGNVLSNQTPLCEQESKINIPKKTIKQGTNTITYTSKERTIIKQPTITLTNTKGKHFATTYTLNNAPKKLELQFTLPETGTKEFTVTHNEKEYFITTTETFATLDVTNATRTGLNTL
ncbi:MAG: hypothetical protein AAB356_05435, partial [Deltaproteobacteria bacterium]